MSSQTLGNKLSQIIHDSNKNTLGISLARQLTNERMLLLKTVIWKENYAEKDLIKKSASGWIPDRTMPLSQEMSHPSEYCISAWEVRITEQQICSVYIHRSWCRKQSDWFALSGQPAISTPLRVDDERS